MCNKGTYWLWECGSVKYDVTSLHWPPGTFSQLSGLHLYFGFVLAFFMRLYVDTSFQAKHQRVWLHFGYQCWLAVPTAHFFPDGTHTIFCCVEERLSPDGLGRRLPCWRTWNTNVYPQWPQRDLFGWRERFSLSLPSKGTATQKPRGVLSFLCFRRC